MKTLKVLIIFLLAISLVNCAKDDSSGDNNIPAYTVSPANPDQLASVLVIPNSEVVASATMPASSSPATAPVVSHIDTNISYSAGTQLYIPCDVSSPTANNIAGVYIQVKGASTYFDVPIDATPNGLISLPVDLPSIVGPGNFTLILKFYDTAGNIGLITEVHITVTAPSSCGTTKVSGGEGLTSNIFKIPAGSQGNITLSYDTFVVPDKIDVFQNGVWIAGTGPSTQRATLRRALNCNVATEAAGYKGEEGEFVFEFNATSGSEIEVVVSGCEDGGTAWEYTFSCPQVPVPGFGTVVLDGVSYSTNCEASNIDQTCSAQALGVNLEDFEGDIPVTVDISNMPQESSGTFPLYVGNDWDWCDLRLSGFIGNVGSSVDFYTTVGITGSITKTGPKSFTFIKTWTNTFTGTNHTLTGSGVYQ